MRRDDIENGIVLDDEPHYPPEYDDEYYEEQELERIRNIPEPLGSHCVKPIKED